MLLKEISTLIFDLDGTLFQTEKMALPAFRCTFERLMEQGICQRMPSGEQMTSVFGMTTADLWKTLLPTASDEERALADEILLEEELAHLNKGYGELYPHVWETLSYFQSRRLRLYIASNGGERYVKGVARAMGIERFFLHIYSAGEYKTARKEDLVARLLADDGGRPAVMVGDRQSDVKAGKENGLFVVGCDFGFARPHELDGADRIIHHFSELRQIIGV
jgi:phosphoglycolate phosphatase